MADRAHAAVHMATAEAEAQRRGVSPQGDALKHLEVRDDGIPEGAFDWKGIEKKMGVPVRMTPMEIQAQAESAARIFRCLLEGVAPKVCYPETIDHWYEEHYGKEWVAENNKQRHAIIKEMRRDGEHTPEWRESLSHMGDIAWEIFDGSEHGEVVRPLAEVDREEVKCQFQELMPYLKPDFPNVHFSRCGAGDKLYGLRACCATLRTFAEDSEIVQLCAEVTRLTITENEINRDGLASVSMPMPPRARTMNYPECGFGALRALLGAFVTQAPKSKEAALEVVKVFGLFKDSPNVKMQMEEMRTRRTPKGEGYEDRQEMQEGGMIKQARDLAKGFEQTPEVKMFVELLTPVAEVSEWPEEAEVVEVKEEVDVTGEVEEDHRMVPIRPVHTPSIDTWLTAGAKTLAKGTGKLYHEVAFGESYVEDTPQIGWLTESFKEGDVDFHGVGDDEHGWATDGTRHQNHHKSEGKDARWPRDWKGGDVIGFAVDFDSGKMRFSLNGEWLSSVETTFDSGGHKLFPAVSMRGFYVVNIPQATWRFAPPEDSYEEWGDHGFFARPNSEELNPDHAKAMRTVFDTFDKDKSGAIDGEEIKEAMIQIGIKPKHDNLHQLIHHCGLNKKRVKDLEEMLKHQDDKHEKDRVKHECGGITFTEFSMIMKHMMLEAKGEDVSSPVAVEKEPKEPPADEEKADKPKEEKKEKKAEPKKEPPRCPTQ